MSNRRFAWRGIVHFGMAAAASSSCASGLSTDDFEQTERLGAALLAALEVRVNGSGNDAEQSSSGSMSLTSSDLELVTDSSTQSVGMRFQNVTVPKGATITNASLRFTVDETGLSTTNLTIRAQAADDPGAFTTSRNNISSRSLTSAAVSWTPSAWTSVGQTHATPNLGALVTEVINRNGWAPGNSMVFVVTGSGKRTAEAFDGVASAAPLLRIEYETASGACGDTVCGGGETCSSCSSDCGACATCSDGIQNQGEAAIDCGGPCPACACGSACQAPTVPNLRVAFLGDQGNNTNADNVLQLIRNEGAHAAVHNGDFDYADNPTAWDNRVTSVLGASYPYFAIVGNHDAAAWSGSNGYAAKLAARHARNSEMQCTGELGVKANCTFRGLHLVQSCIGTNELRSSCGANSSEHVSFIRDSLASSSSIFKICAWHKNQNDMQVGTKGNEVGWSAYQECQAKGAIVATGHEHSYSRTRTLTALGNPSAGHGVTGAYDVAQLGLGRTFVFVSGLGGASVRAYSASQHDDDTWWSSYYASNRWLMNGVLQSGSGTYGALFVDFYVDGDPKKARAYFKDVGGRVADSFVIQVE